MTRETRKTTRNTTKSTFAIPAAPVAMPPNPKIAATMATMKNVNAQLSMSISSNRGSSPRQASWTRLASTEAFYDVSLAGLREASGSAAPCNFGNRTELVRLRGRRKSDHEEDDDEQGTSRRE